MGAHQSVTINGRKLRITKQLAEGGFGFVYVAKDAQTKELFALKQIRCSIDEQIRNAEWEIQVSPTRITADMRVIIKKAVISAWVSGTSEG